MLVDRYDLMNEMKRFLDLTAAWKSLDDAPEVWGVGIRPSLLFPDLTPALAWHLFQAKHSQDGGKGLGKLCLGEANEETAEVSILRHIAAFQREQNPRPMWQCAS